MDETFKAERDDWLIRQHASGGTGPVELKMNAMLIREYGEPARRIILDKRAETRARDAAWQRKWAARLSRRPGRNYVTMGDGSRRVDKHAWHVREQYVRYSQTWPNPTSH